MSPYITAEDTRTAELLYPELVRPITIVKYGVDVRVSCKGGSIYWTERNHANVVRATRPLLLKHDRKAVVCLHTLLREEAEKNKAFWVPAKQLQGIYYRTRQPRAVQEGNEPWLHPRLRGHVLFLLFVRARGAALAPQGQEAARGCRLRQPPERVTPLERRQTAKVACPLSTHRAGVGATFPCSWAPRWCPDTYFLPYSAQSRY